MEYSPQPFQTTRNLYETDAFANDIIKRITKEKIFYENKLPLFNSLNREEISILSEFGKGLSPSQIALKFEKKTFKILQIHKNIKSKLKAENIRDLIDYCIAFDI